MSASGEQWAEFNQGGGFIVSQNDSPVAMDNEVCVDGKYQVGKASGKKGGKKKDEGSMKDVFKAFRMIWSTRDMEDIDKKKHPNAYVKVCLRELGIYLGFLLVLSIIAYGQISSQNYNTALVMNSALITSQAAFFPYIGFTDVTRMSDIWRILIEGGTGSPLLGNLYSAWYGTPYSNVSAPQDISPYIGNENYVLGLSRLRQLRVKSDSCTIPDDFKNEIKACYADYASRLEEKSSFGPYASENYTNQTTYYAWFWNSETKLDGTSYTGRMNSYSGSGYVQTLPNNADDAYTVLMDLYNNLWIDRATRVVFFDVMTYNPNINLFCQTKMLFEMPATGGVVPTFKIRPAKLLRYVSAFDYIVLVFQFLLVGYLLYYFVEEVLEIKKHKLSYFKSIWNILDVVILCMCVVCIVFNIYEYVKIDSLLSNLLKNTNQYIDFEFLCYWDEQYLNAFAGIVFISWIKIFKYVNFNKTMTQLSLTLSRCAKDVAGFAIMFFIVFLAYAQLGYLIFGTQVYEFSTFAQSIFTLFRIVLGDFNFEAIEKANRVLGPIFFLTYVFFVFFVLLNMFIAIINDTYGEIKEELQDAKSDIELAGFFKLGYNKVLDKLNVQRKRNIDIVKTLTAEDIGPEETLNVSEFATRMKAKGYSTAEIEALTTKYDEEGTGVLDATQKMNMLRDLMVENKELKEAYMALEKNQADREAEEERRKKRCDGVIFEDYSLLSGRIDRMEGSIASIVGKVDAVLNKLDAEEQARNEAGEGRENTGMSFGSRANNQSYA